MLARLFSEGHDSVDIVHPTDGPITVTKAEFQKHLRDISKQQNMSPADRVIEATRLNNIKKKKQDRFKAAMILAPAHEVNIEDEENFGKDIEGQELDIDKMMFMPICQYLPGINPLTHEIGCFYDENDEERSPVRIIAQT